MKNEKGITLIALVITIIVIAILAAVGFGSGKEIKNNVNETQDSILLSDLSKIQQSILEAYIKYKTVNNPTFLKGKKLQYSVAQGYLNEIDSSLSLKKSAYDNNAKDDEIYYELDKYYLKDLGVLVTVEDDKYVVNYSTGEVFNITTKTTSDERALYISN